MNEPDLVQVLRRATEELPVVDRSQESWRRAQRIRSRRAVAAAGGAVVLVLGSVVGVLAWQGNLDRPPAPTETPSPSEDVPPDAKPVPWDPFTLAQEPRAESVLPERLAPPAVAPSVEDEPLPAAVVAWPEEGRDLMLLGTDGSWRSVPGTADPFAGSWIDVVDPALSPDGTRVALSIDAGILVVDVTTGERRVIEWAAELEPPWDDPPGLAWLPGEDGFFVSTWPRAWLVGPDGEARRAPYGGRYGLGVAIDPEGPVLEHLYDEDAVVEWDGDEVVGRAELPTWGQREVTRFGLLAFTGGPGYGSGRSGPLVFDAATGQQLAAASIRDPRAWYSDSGGVTALGFLDQDTVLLMVQPRGPRDRTGEDLQTHLVAWGFREATFERITQGDWRARAVDVAPALVEDGAP